MISNKKELKELKELNDVFDKNKQLVLGEYKPKSIFKRTEYLTITKEYAKQNILVSGSAGSGKTNLSFYLAAQSMKAGYGLIYMNFLWNGHVEPQLEALAKLFNRENDILFFNIDDKDFNEVDIDKMVNENKIIVITSKNIEKMSESDFIKTLCIFSDLLLKIKKPINRDFPYMVFIDGLHNRKEKDLDKIKAQIVRLNNLNIGFVSICQGLPFVTLGIDIFVIFKNLLMLKTEDVEGLNDFLDLGVLDLRDLRSQNVGEFYFFKNEKLANIKYYKSALATLR